MSTFNDISNGFWGLLFPKGKKATKGTNKAVKMDNILLDLFHRYIKEVEGGYVDHPKDPGGKTNMGVTIGAFKTLAPKLLGIQGTVENLKSLTDEQHKKILMYYFTMANGEEFKSPVIGLYATELTWGSGESGAKKMLSKAAQSLGATLTATNGITSKDVAILNTLPQADLFRAITTARTNFYKSIKGKDGKLLWDTFGRGWAARIKKFSDIFANKV